MMVYKYIKNSKSRNSQRGGVTLLVLLLIPVLLMVGGLAINVGKIYRDYIQLQKAADVATLSGIGYSILNSDLPSGASAYASTIQDKANEILLENLKLSKVPTTNANIPTPNYNSISQSLSTTFQYPSALAFRYGFTTSSVNLNINATSRRRRANVGMVLDFSASMNCPRTGVCDCLSPARTVTCDNLGVTQKIDDLRSSASVFVQKFNQATDRVSLTLFNTTAQVLVGAQASGFSATTITDAISETPSSGSPIIPSGATNISDGLLRSYTNFNSLGIVNNEDISYFVFSDGAPTATRFLLSSPKPGGTYVATLDTNNPYGLGSYDYTNFSVEWPNHNISPGLLIRTETIPFGYTDTAAPDPRGTAPYCSPSTKFPPENPTYFHTVFSGCLSNLGFHMPGLPLATYGAECGSSTQYLSCWRQQYYNTTIQVSDFLRTVKSRIFTVGLGPAADLAAAITANDPYQVIDDTHSRKDIFLTRIANDYFEAVPLSNSQYGASHPEVSYTNYSNYATLGGTAFDKHGRYFSTDDSAVLSKLFEAAAVRILLRLTS